ncbi:anti-sigma-factor antagonist [Beggiatoa sp. PS]|nr:anti-sigma-factor antagonist [Beggiatoa sp. PS]
MIVSQITVEANNAWRLSGELTFTTVGELLSEFTEKMSLLDNGGAKKIQPAPQVMDLSDVTRTDSAGLAFLIELQKQTKDAPITFCNMPAQMLSLASVSDVQDLLTQTHQSS